MRRSVMFEVEHRRGLVLGFTLAEVLLLLLFLLLLALGAKVARLERDGAMSPDAAKAELRALKEKTAAILPLLPEAEKINRDAPAEPLKLGLELMRQLGRDIAPDQRSKVMVQLSALMREAARLDPESPAVPLKSAASVMQELPSGASPASTGADLAALAREAAHLKPEDPAAPLEKGLEIMRRAGPDARPEEAMRAGGRLADLVQEAKAKDPRDPVGVLQRALETTASLPPGASGKHDWPPIINLSEAEGYYFETGSAELPPKFRDKLSVVVEQLRKIVRDYGDYGINVVEVVGHTDEQPLAGRPSNLDKLLHPTLDGLTAERLTPSDNAGLGLARAAAVVRALRENGGLGDLRILPLTGGQLIDTGDTLSDGENQAVKERRRIEIRVRRSDRKPSAEMRPDVPPLARPLPMQPEPKAASQTAAPKAAVPQSPAAVQPQPASKPQPAPQPQAQSQPQPRPAPPAATATLPSPPPLAVLPKPDEVAAPQPPAAPKRSQPAPCSGIDAFGDRCR